jgi:hypothetical protein
VAAKLTILGLLSIEIFIASHTLWGVIELSARAIQLEYGISRVEHDLLPEYIYLIGLILNLVQHGDSW